MITDEMIEQYRASLVPEGRNFTDPSGRPLTQDDFAKCQFVRKEDDERWWISCTVHGHGRAWAKDGSY